MENVILKLIAMSRIKKQLLIIAIDIILSIIATWLSFFVRLDLEVFIFPYQNTIIPFILAIGIFMPLFLYLRIYQNVNRYMDIKSLNYIFYILIVYAFIYFGIIFFSGIPQVPRSIGIIQPIIFTIFVISIRIIALGIINFPQNNNKRINILIYGAGEAGANIIKAISQNNFYKIIGFIDDDLSKTGSKIFNTPVFNPNDLKRIVEKEDIQEVLITIRNISNKEKKDIFNKLQNFNLKIKILPSFDDFVRGKINIQDFKEIQVKDLINREIKKNIELLDGDFRNKKFLITGAGGSVGSELCKQIIEFSPTRIVLIDNSEFNLYKIEANLLKIKKDKDIKTEVISFLTSINNKEKISNIFDNYKSDYVYHAAAFKHVPMVEKNIYDALENNFLGTVNVVNSFLNSECKKFTLISTDKAVRPTNVMGATKRLSEIYVQSLSEKSKLDNKILSIVRFGNVLDSSGSVVPLFREQIKKGGPITVTHKDVTRYFMTISEASNLILQSSSLALGGEVFILDMGEPVKIYDLAKKMIKLSGLEIKSKNKEGDIEIIFTGLRPGEKLFEELLIDEFSLKTINKDILIAKENHLSYDEIKKIYDDVRNNYNVLSDRNIVSKLKQSITDYK